SAMIEQLESRKMLTGLIIHPTWDTSITSDTTNGNNVKIEATIQQVINEYEASFTDPITVNIKFVKDLTTDLGASQPPGVLAEPYTTFRNALVANQSTSYDATALAKLSTGPNDPNLKKVDVNLKPAELKALGIPFTALASD